MQFWPLFFAALAPACAYAGIFARLAASPRDRLDSATNDAGIAASPLQQPTRSFLEEREHLWKTHIENGNGDFEALKEHATDAEKAHRAGFVTDAINKFGLKRGGTEPVYGRGIFSDEDLECPEESKGCIEEFTSFAEAQGYAVEDKPLFISVPDLDILLWKPEKDHDFCTDRESWRKHMETLADEKEKSIVSRAEALGKNVDSFEAMETVLEMISKSRDYLSPDTFKKTKGFQRWDKFAQMAKAMRRSMLAAKVTGQGSLPSNEYLMGIAKMKLGPHDLDMSHEQGHSEYLTVKQMTALQHKVIEAFERSLINAARFISEKANLFAQTNDKNGRVGRGGSRMLIRHGTMRGEQYQNSEAIRRFVEALHRMQIRIQALNKANVVLESMPQAKSAVDGALKKLEGMMGKVCANGDSNRDAATLIGPDSDTYEDGSSPKRRLERSTTADRSDFLSAVRPLVMGV